MKGSRCMVALVVLYVTALHVGTPLSKTLCKMAAGGYDCSDQDLQTVPDSVDLPGAAKILDFSFNHLPALYNTTFGRLTQLVSLDLTRCKINWIYEKTFQNQIHLESLVLTGNPLGFMADEAFSGPLALKDLRLAQTSLDDLKFIPHLNLMSLETLELGDNDIYTLHGLKEFNWETITTLNLQFNDLQRIWAGEVAVLKNGRGLNVSFRGNSIVHVEPKAFESCHFNTLDFTGCFDDANVSVILAGLSGVQTNILLMGTFEESKPSTIKAQSLRAFCDITVNELRLQLHHFEDIADVPFHCLSGLETLDLTRSHLVSLPDTLGQMNALSKLVLDENKFYDLCHTNVNTLPTLTVLFVKRNLHVTLRFDDSCLSALSQLEQLDLGQSRLATGAQCCEIQLTGLSHLQTLNLSHSQMRWSALPFQGVPSLRRLDCRAANVTRDDSMGTEGGPFENLHDLKWLTISWRFRDLAGSRDFLKGLRSLEYMSLAGSYFTDGVIPDAEMFVHVPLLQSLVLSDCGLTTVSDRMFVHLGKLVYADLSGNKLAVVNTKAFPSLKKILLNFARNDVETVDVASVTGLGEGSKIDVSDNPLACNCSNVQFIVWMQINTNKVQNIDGTWCAGSREKPSAVHLNCGPSTSGILAFGLVVLVIGILVTAFVLGRKWRRSHIRYEHL